MLDLQSTQARAASFVFGGALHLLIFQRGEWDMSVPRLLQVFGSIQILLLVYLGYLQGDNHLPLKMTARIVFTLSSCLVTGLITSIVVYRLFFHRLNKFPGSGWARLSNFYVTILSARKLHLYEEVEKLHEEYGDFVRVGNITLSQSSQPTLKWYRPVRTVC